MDTTTLNLNAAECLRSATHLGYTKVHNVCAKTTYDVPWGFMDWLAVIGAIVGGVLALLIFTLLFLYMFFDL